MTRQVMTNPVSRYKSVALPAEHGGWGFLLEPMIAGLLIAPSWAGLWLCLSALGIFLIHQPLRIVVKDRLKGRRYERTRWAERFAAVYGGLALVTFVLAWTQAEAAFWLPVAAAALLASLQLVYEGRSRGRELAPEVFGALALGATAPAVVLAAGESPSLAFILWLLMALRAVPSLLYVRALLRGQREGDTQSLLPVGAHVVAVIVALALRLGGWVSWIGLTAPLVLLARAVYGLRRRQTPVRARDIGIQEMIFGLVFAVLVTLGVSA